MPLFCIEFDLIWLFFITEVPIHVTAISWSSVTPKYLILGFEETFTSLQETDILLTLSNLFFKANKMLSVFYRWSESLFSSSQTLRDANSLLNLSSISPSGPSHWRQEQSHPCIEKDQRFQFGPWHSHRLWTTMDPTDGPFLVPTCDLPYEDAPPLTSTNCCLPNR